MNSLTKNNEDKARKKNIHTNADDDGERVYKLNLYYSVDATLPSAYK